MRTFLLIFRYCLLVLDDFEPTSELRITYHVTKQLTPGTDITLEEVESAPHVWFSNADHEAQYTLVMV